MEGRQFSRNKKPRETLVGVDSSGAEYWLVPFSDKKAGNRKFEIRNSQKHVPPALQGMITDANTGMRLFEKHQAAEKAKKAKPRTTAKAK